VAVVDGGNTEEHEDDGLRRAAQHLQGIFDRRVRLVRYIGLHVIFHGYTTKSYSAEAKGRRGKSIKVIEARRWRLELTPKYHSSGIFLHSNRPSRP
jgi:hypothetical protein